MQGQSSPGLFREEAVKHAFSSTQGHTVVRMPRVLSWGARLLFLVALCAAGLLASMQITWKEHVSGVLQPSLGAARVTAALTGTLTDLRVSPGEKVQKGQTIAVFVPDLSRQGGREAVLAQLEAALRRKSEMAQQTGTAKLQHEIWVQRLSGTIAADELERQALSEQIEIESDIEARLRKQAEIALQLAAKKLVSEREAQQRQNDFDDARTQEAILKRERARLDSALLQARSDIDTSAKDLNLTLSRLKVETLEIDSQITALRGELSVDVQSPIKGSVDYVAYQPGETVAEGSLLFSIVPDGSGLRAEIFVPSRAIARIKAGQPVRIEYDAFPAEFFGYAKAFLTSFNETLLDPAEARRYGVNLSGPVYRLSAALQAQSVQEHQREVKLRAGMTFSADILIEKHPLYIWMWRKLSRAPKAL